MPLALATRQSHHWQSSLQPSPWHSNKLKIYSQWPGQYFKLKRQLTWFKNFENSWDSSSLVASPSAGTGSTTSDTGSLFFKVFVKCPWTEQETVSSFHWISENCFKHDSAHSIGKKCKQAALQWMSWCCTRRTLQGFGHGPELPWWSPWAPIQLTVDCKNRVSTTHLT